MFSRSGVCPLLEGFGDLRERVLFKNHIVKGTRTSVQIIRPRPGETRKLPPSSRRARAETRYVGQCLHAYGLEEEGDQAEDERVEGDSLGQGEAEPADLLELVLHLRLAGD